MDLVIDVVGLEKTELQNQISVFSDAELIQSSGVLGGDPILTAVVHDALTNLPAILSSLATVLLAWGKRDSLKRVVLQEKGKKPRTLDLQGLSGEELKTVLKSSITEFSRGKTD
jgi:hypothetical protein